MASVWTSTVTPRPPRPALQGDQTTDVLIIGGGMAGILTAYRLKEAGVSCVVLEAKTVGDGVTKNTTAKITAQHGLIYADLIRRFGLPGAKLHYKANTRAIRDFAALAKAHPCDFEEKTAFVYALSDRQRLMREAEAYRALLLRAEIRNELPLPLSIVGALAMDKQAQFHPLKLLCALADQLDVYENSFVRRVEGTTAFTAEGTIRAKRIVFATHFPLVNIPGLYFIKLYQHRSYVLALKGAPPLEGMYVDEREEGHSFRRVGDLLLLGGGDHRTGKPGGGYAELRRLAGNAYPEAAETYSWATQDCMSLDGLPYIGRHRRGAGNHYVATGFNKWGMTGSMVASELLCDLLVRGRSALEALYSPQRSLLTGQLFQNLASATAGLVRLGGPRCSHMGCKLHWNGAEGSWDCACHGSRFDRAGQVMDNPAKGGIRR